MTGEQVSTNGRVADGVLFAELYPGLRRFAGIVRPDEVDADDLVQEALTRTLAVRRLVECDDPGAYLRTAIVRLAANHRRSFGRRGRALARLVPDTVEEPSYPWSMVRDGTRCSRTSRESPSGSTGGGS